MHFVLPGKKRHAENTSVPRYVNPIRWTKSSGFSTSSESLISHKYWWSSSGPTLKDKQFGSVKHLMLQMSFLVVLMFIITWLVRALSWTGWEYFSWRHSRAEIKLNTKAFSPTSFACWFLHWGRALVIHHDATLKFPTFMCINQTISLMTQSSIRSDEGLALETSAFESIYGGQFTLSTQLIKPNYLVILPPTQHHSSVET